MDRWVYVIHVNVLHLREKHSSKRNKTYFFSLPIPTQHSSTAPTDMAVCNSGAHTHRTNSTPYHCSKWLSSTTPHPSLSTTHTHTHTLQRTWNQRQPESTQNTVCFILSIMHNTVCLSCMYCSRSSFCQTVKERIALQCLLRLQVTSMRSVFNYTRQL